ncbi:MAG: hypothetical protein KF745_07735 [Phycisphaeraceae bacterium]|nr:hypothetical protein [Phycisphaeraceae bacterium]
MPSRFLTRPAGAVAALFLTGLVVSCGRHDTGATGTAPISNAKSICGLGEQPGRFAYPRAMDSDGDSLWIVDKTARVQKIDPNSGACLASFRMPDSALGKPVGITCVSLAAGSREDSYLYIADTHYSRVMVYRPPPGPDAPPVLVASVGSYGMEPGQFIYPTDVAVLTSPDRTRIERIYVTEYGGNDRVSVFDSEWKFLFSFGSYGASTSPDSVQFDRPQSIAITRDAAGAPAGVIITDARNNRVGRFTLDGALTAWIGLPGSEGAHPETDQPPVADALTLFKYPYGIALTADRSALIAEFGGNRVSELDLDTNHIIATFGRPGRGEGELATPWAVSLQGGRVHVLDSGNNRVVSFPLPRRKV